jgi:hypothetical protein
MQTLKKFTSQNILNFNPCYNTTPKLGDGVEYDLIELIDTRKFPLNEIIWLMEQGTFWFSVKAQHKVLEYIARKYEHHNSIRATKEDIDNAVSKTLSEDPAVVAEGLLNLKRIVLVYGPFPEKDFEKLDYAKEAILEAAQNDYLYDEA